MPAPKRITLRSIIDELLLLANLEKGLGYTVKMMALAPGKAIRNYLFEDRKKMTRPFTFLILTLTLATFLTIKLLPTGEALWEEVQKDIGSDKLPEQFVVIIRWLSIAIKKYTNLFYASSLPGLTLATYFIFREKGYNFAEHLVINTYVFSFQTFLTVIFLPFLVENSWLGVIMVILVSFYTLFAYTRVFEQSFWKGIGKSILAYFIAQLFSSVVLLIALLIAWLWLMV